MNIINGIPSRMHKDRRGVVNLIFLPMGVSRHVMNITNVSDDTTNDPATQFTDDLLVGRTSARYAIIRTPAIYVVSVSCQQNNDG